MKTTSLLFLIAIPAASWAQAVGPIDASQVPDGQIVVYNQSGLSTTGALATCSGALEYLGLPNCPPSTAYVPVITSNLTGNTGTKTGPSPIPPTPSRRAIPPGFKTRT